LKARWNRPMKMFLSEEFQSILTNFVTLMKKYQLFTSAKYNICSLQLNFWRFHY